MEVLNLSLELFRNDGFLMLQLMLLITFIIFLLNSIKKEKKNPLSAQVLKRIEKKNRGDSEKKRIRKDFFIDVFENIIDRADKKTKRSNLDFSAKEYVTFILIGMGGGAVLGLVIFPFKTIFTSIFFFVNSGYIKLFLGRLLSGISFSSLGYFLPIAVVYFRERKRRKDLEDQLIDFILSMADSIFAANTPQEALRLVSNEISEPLASELKKTVNEIDLSIPYEDALVRLEERLNLEEYSLILSSLQIQSRTGGHLESMLRNSARVAEERRNTKDEVLQVINETSRIAYVLIASPIVTVIGIAFMMREEFTDGLFTFLGAVYFGVLGIIYVLGIIGVLAIRKSIVKLL